MELCRRLLKAGWDLTPLPSHPHPLPHFTLCPSQSTKSEQAGQVEGGSCMSRGPFVSDSTASEDL